MKGVFVTGTGTDVGKTVVAAWLVRSWRGEYWKPVQSGTRDGWDADVVRSVAPDAIIHPSRYSLPDPLSPHEAARLAGVCIDLDQFQLPTISRPLVVEGAGGAMVPLNERDLMVDLMARLALPVLVVAQSGLGTINHTLLTLEALRHHGLVVAGVVLNGPRAPANRQAIEAFGRISVVAELPPLPNLEELGRYPPIAWECQS